MYIHDIFDTMVDGILNDKLEAAEKALKEQTPLPMNTMLDKQPRAEAIQKKKARDTMQLEDVPPTNPGIIMFQRCSLNQHEISISKIHEHHKPFDFKQ